MQNAVEWAGLFREARGVASRKAIDMQSVLLYNTLRKGCGCVRIEQIANIKGGQDGAIYGSELFRLDTNGECCVYDLAALKDGTCDELKPIAQFTLDRADSIVPHSNAVCFGCEFFDEQDDYPLLYSNIYNNYHQSEDPMLGVCLVYRICRTGNGFSSTLVQMIRIGFCEDAGLWKASEAGHGVRPYGNFVIDQDTRSYWAFVMRNEALGTRYFRFDLPSVHSGEMDEKLKIRSVVLEAEDIRTHFDCGHHYYIQGATLHEGKIYSTEGFHNDLVNRPAIRRIDLATKQEEFFDIIGMGLIEEPEFIDFYNGVCLYGDANGKLYRVEF